MSGQQKSESGLSGETDLAAAHQQVLADLSHSNGWGLRFQMVTAATTICVEMVVVCGLCVPVRPNYRGVQEPIANHGGMSRGRHIPQALAATGTFGLFGY